MEAASRDRAEDGDRGALYVLVRLMCETGGTGAFCVQQHFAPPHNDGASTRSGRPTASEAPGELFASRAPYHGCDYEDGYDYDDQN
jgi:hypothetical protein